MASTCPGDKGSLGRSGKSWFEGVEPGPPFLLPSPACMVGGHSQLLCACWVHLCAELLGV